jgi:dephospho-CoA kinase
MLTIGLAGGVASGKSFVAGKFQSLGAQVIDADSLGHKVLFEAEVVDDIVQAFGAGMLGDDRQLNRERIAEVVFGQDLESRENLRVLEQIVHPKITNLIVSNMEKLRAENVLAVILDAPVMFKTGWDEFCDKIVFVQASYEVRLERALKRGWTQEHFALREASQTPIEVKRQRATDVIDNEIERSKESTEQQIVRLWQKWNLPLPDKT